MTPDLINAAVRLADLLAEENAALLTLDLPRAAALSERKAQAMDAFSTARAHTTAQPASGTAVTREVTLRLNSLAEQNRSLLERAMHVQARVIGTIARVGAQSMASNAPRYGARGQMTAAPRTAAFALSARV